MDGLLRKLESGVKVTIVALGDSITELTWHTRGYLNWCGYLQEALFEKFGRNRCFVINAGRCGDTAGGALDRLDDDVLRFAPDLVIISFGMNDSGMPVESFPEHLNELIARIRAGSEAEILLRTPNPIVTPPGTPGESAAALESADARVGLLSQTIVDVAGRSKCAIVDHYALWKNMPAPDATMKESVDAMWLRMSDSVHPGPQGHLAFFRELAPRFNVPVRFGWET